MRGTGDLQHTLGGADPTNQRSEGTTWPLPASHLSPLLGPIPEQRGGRGPSKRPRTSLLNEVNGQWPQHTRVLGDVNSQCIFVDLNPTVLELKTSFQKVRVIRIALISGPIL